MKKNVFILVTAIILGGSFSFIDSFKTHNINENTINQLIKLEDGKVIVLFPSGNKKTIELTQEGLLTFQKFNEEIRYFANK